MIQETMSTDKNDIFIRFKQEIPSGALSRQNDGALYIFMKEQHPVEEKYNLLIFDGGSPPQKSNYSFLEKNGSYFIKIDGVDYEMILPDTISDEDPFILTLKASDGQLIQFENYI